MTTTFETDYPVPGRVQENQGTQRMLEEVQKERYQAPSGQKAHPIDSKLDICEENSRSTEDTVNCAKSAEKSWDGELNKAYRSLQTEQGLSPAQKNALLESQRQWMKFRDAEFESIDQIYNNQGIGTISEPWAAHARSGMVKERAVELQNHGGDFSNGHVADRIDVPQCKMLYSDCVGEAYDLADAKLNKFYGELMSKLNKDGQEALRNSEREWMKFRDKEFEFLDSYFDSRYSGNRIENLQYKVDIVNKRAARLEHQLSVLTGN